MLRSVPTFAWSRALLLLALPGCLVSFNDYPLGDPQEAAASADKASSSHGSASMAGASVLPSGGGSAPAGSTTGGTNASDAGSPDAATGGTTSVGSNPMMVDDFEDGNAGILEQQGRSGAWYVANDGRGTQTPRSGVPLVPSALEPPRAKSARAAHSYGGPFSGWGALIGTQFTSSGNNGVPYDVSAYQGLRFWVRYGDLFPNPARSVRLNLPTAATLPGGDCIVCGDHFGAEIPLTSQWARVEVPFSKLKQSDYGGPSLGNPDLQHAMSIELLFPPNVTFDLWIDDVELY